MSSGAILTCDDFTADQRLSAQACVIGSGAGGAAAAARLAERGLDVLILEAGSHHPTDSFTCNPHEMACRLYGEAALSSTLGSPAILVYYGRCLGGSTTVNAGTCFRTPGSVLDDWRRRFGLETLSAEALDPYYFQVEEDIHVEAPPLSHIGRNGQLLHEARLALGVSGGVIRRNARGCQASGLCCFGCPTGAKQSTLVSYIPKAIDAGARVITDARADLVRSRGGRAAGVEASILDPARPGAVKARLSIEAPIVVVAAGTLSSPELLHRSGVRPKALGRHLTLHPALKLAAIMDEEVIAWEGVPQSYYIDEWHDEGFLIESITVPPTLEALSLPGAGPGRDALVELIPRMAHWGAMVSDTSEGRLRFLGSETLASYQMNRRDTAVAVESLARCAELAFAAGARRVVTPLYGLPFLNGPDDIRRLRAGAVRASDIDLAAFHPLGTCRMSAEPRDGVVDERQAVHGFEGLYVVDGSVFPGSMSVNPQLTIMAFALRAADGIADRAMTS